MSTCCFAFSFFFFGSPGGRPGDKTRLSFFFFGLGGVDMATEVPGKPPHMENRVGPCKKSRRLTTGRQMTASKK